MFRWFEKRLEPFPAAEPAEPPKTLVAFCLHYTRGAWRFILLDALLIAAIARGTRPLRISPRADHDSVSPHLDDLIDLQIELATSEDVEAPSVGPLQEKGPPFAAALAVTVPSSHQLMSAAAAHDDSQVLLLPLPRDAAVTDE